MATTKNEYDKLPVEAAHRVLLELSRLLYDYKEGIVVVGGLVPGLLFDQTRSNHIGTIDVDLALDQTIIQEIGYRSILQLLKSRDYTPGNQPFVFFRTFSIENQKLQLKWIS